VPGEKLREEATTILSSERRERERERERESEAKMTADRVRSRPERKRMIGRVQGAG
jgi:hypothetical protein